MNPRDVSSPMVSSLTGPEIGVGEQVAFLKSILDGSTEYSIVAGDLNGTVLAWNEGARRIYGYQPEDMIGKSALLLHCPDEVKQGRAQARLDEARAKGKWSGEVRQMRKDGSTFSAFVSIMLRHNAQHIPVGFTMISEDRTEQERLEQSLQRKNQELEEQNRRVVEASRLKSEFLANMSHELRTPLNSIIGFSELLHDGKAGPMIDKQKEYIGDVLTSGRHLLRLINDVLDLSKVESGKMEFLPEPIDPKQLLREVHDILRAQLSRKHLHLEVKIAPELKEIVLDPGKLKQVLFNYLSNAIKFTPDEGYVTVEMRPDGIEDFIVEVKDTGIGIKPEDIKRLFVEFQQLDASARKKYQGTGLGLSLAKRIVEAQGGSVGVTSVFGKGSVFFARLPRKQARSSGPDDAGERNGPVPNRVGIQC